MASGLPSGSTRDRQIGRHVVFWLERRPLALPIASVREVVEGLQIAPVPHGPPHVLGIASLRGTVLSIMDLHGVLSGRPSTSPASRFLIAVRDGAVVTGFTVDRVHGVMHLAADSAIVDHAAAREPFILAHHDLGLGALVAELDAPGLFTQLESRRMAALAAQPMSRRSPADE